MQKCINCKIKTNFQTADVMWLGLSSKVDTMPFDIKTNSGIVINKIEVLLPNIDTYKTNLVKCAPLDENSKLRYPTQDEIKCCLVNFDLEVNEVKPKVIVLLGGIVQKAIANHKHLDFKKIEESKYYAAIKDNIYYLKVEHPSYLYIYKRKHLDERIHEITNAIDYLLKRKH